MAQEIEKVSGDNLNPTVLTSTEVCYESPSDSSNSQRVSTPVYDLADLKSGMKIPGPAIILNQTSTILVEPSWVSTIDDFGNVLITSESEHSGSNHYKEFKDVESVPLDAIELSIFGHRFMSIAE